MSIAIIDYGMGNTDSVIRSIEKCGANPVLSNKTSDLDSASHIILPGVGAFQKGIENINNLGIRTKLEEQVIKFNVPFLGICLGMQLMAKHSEEGGIDGLGWFDAMVVKFRVSDNIKYKVPHIGWNSVVPNINNLIFNNIDRDAHYYFVHSYHIKCNNESDILAKTTYDYEFSSAIKRDNIYGFQFHIIYPLPLRSNQYQHIMLLWKEPIYGYTADRYFLNRSLLGRRTMTLLQILFRLHIEFYYQDY
mgnify:CR=1 FL=1